jgi:hypothetical protein
MCQTRFFLLLYEEYKKLLTAEYNTIVWCGCRQHAMYSEFHFACWYINFAFQFVSSSSFQIFSIFQFEYFLVGGWAFSLTDDRLKMCAGPGLYWGMLNGCVTMETCITAVSYCHFFFFFLFLKEKITLTKESKKPRAYWIPFPGHIEKENMEKTALKF